MRIAVIVPGITRQAPVMVMRDLVNSLATTVQIDVFYIDREVDRSLGWKVPVRRINRIRFSDYDIVHTTGIRPDFIAFVKRGSVKYHISTINSFVFEDLRFRYNYLVSEVFSCLWRRMWKHADKLVCVSGSLKEYYSRWYDDSKMVVVYNGTVESRSSDACSDISNKIAEYHKRRLSVAGTAAGLYRIKAIDRILKALPNENSIALIVIGNGPEHGRLAALASELNISDRVFFSGYMPDARKYMHQFDIYINSSISEGFCLSVMEAVSSRIPVVCPDIPVFRELFSADEVSFFNPEHENSLESAIRQAVTSGKDKSGAAYEKYSRNFTVNKMADEYLKLYKTALSS